MKRIAMGAMAALMTSVPAMAGNHAADKPIEVSVGVGYNIGATTPLGLPASIREIGGYKPGANVNAGVYASKLLSPKWGMGVGLVYDRKGMQASITARNYHLTMEITDGDEVGLRTGYYTGKIRNTTKSGYLSLPVYAMFRPGNNWDFTGGVYLAYALERSFIGHVSEGKMREDPLHPAIGINKAHYNYSDDLSRFDCGLTVGASRNLWRGLSVKANLQWGVISALNKSRRKIDMNTYNIYLNIGVAYTLCGEGR